MSYTIFARLHFCAWFNVTFCYTLTFFHHPKNAVFEHFVTFQVSGQPQNVTF